MKDTDLDFNGKYVDLCKKRVDNRAPFSFLLLQCYLRRWWSVLSVVSVLLEDKLRGNSDQMIVERTAMLVYQ
jgi:hypothetical protein